MKIIKKNIKIILIILICGLVFTSIGVYAENKYNAKDVSYKNITVDEALNDLYSIHTNSYYYFIKKNNIKNMYGVSIEKDEKNEFYYNFDGNGSYILFNYLFDDYSFEDGIIIEFSAKWNSLGKYGYVFILGNEYMGISNYSTSNILRVFGVNTGTTIKVGERHDYKIIYDYKTSKLDIYVDGKLDSTNNCTVKFDSSMNRTDTYIAKSLWDDDTYFDGNLYSLKINQLNGNEVFKFSAN